jgi:hypothetical protein
MPVLLFSKSFMISSIPLPKVYIQNLDSYECDEACLQEFLDKEMIFSFLAHADAKLQSKSLDEARIINISLLNVGALNFDGELKIALLLPYKKIGKYASSTTNAVFAYMMTKNHPFELKSYKIQSEEIADLRLALEQIQKDGFSYVIAPVTLSGANNLVSINPSINIYLPTINKSDVVSNSPYILFGGIDYRMQSDILLKEVDSRLVIFSDKSQTGQKITHYQEQKMHARTYFIAPKTTNFENILKGNRSLVNGSFFLNTPIIKSGMIMSQLTLHDIKPQHILSTQINYDPLILSMTQYNDRKNMIVANSITEKNNVLIETNALLGNDIVYDWINYTTTVGLDYFYNQLTGEDKEYQAEMREGQMRYKVELLKASHSKFTKYQPLFEERE